MADAPSPRTRYGTTPSSLHPALRGKEGVSFKISGHGALPKRQGNLIEVSLKFNNFLLIINSYLVDYFDELVIKPGRIAHHIKHENPIERQKSKQTESASI